jgi:hypothetical protein
MPTETATAGNVRIGGTVKRVFAAAVRARHHMKKVPSVSSSFCSPFPDAPSPDKARENFNDASPFSDVFDISRKAFPDGDIHSWSMHSTSSSITPAPNTSRASPVAVEAPVLPSEPPTPKVRPLPAIPNECHKVRLRRIRALPTPPPPLDSHRNAHPAVLRVENFFHPDVSGCDSPTLVSTALAPPSRAVAPRVANTTEPEADAPIDWDLLEQVLCENAVA